MAKDDVPQVRDCGTMAVHERLLRTDPSYRLARVASENRHWQLAALGASPGRAGITVIPVVVHVVWKTNAQNIDDQQIKSQIEVLNHDFRKTNSDIGSVPGAFAPLAADARIEFELATTDPQGDPTNGITRDKTTKDSFTDNDDVKHAANGGADAWPADAYLNLWVCQLAGTLLGYAQFPGGPAATDGVVIRHSAFGTTGTAAAPFNLGRTATHEIGHWLNLRHIWGDDGGGCNGDDFVADTPNCADSNTGKPAFPHITCSNGPNGDMFMNYMDYTDDDAMFMFSAGQVARMQTSLDTDRPSIGHQKLVTLKFSDDGGAQTLKFRDDGGPETLKFRDDLGPHTLKFRDDVATVKFIDDGGPPQTLKFRDDIGPHTLKFRDDVATIKFIDEPGPGTNKILDDGVQTGPADTPGFPPAPAPAPIPPRSSCRRRITRWRGAARSRAPSSRRAPSTRSSCASTRSCSASTRTQTPRASSARRTEPTPSSSTPSTSAWPRNTVSSAADPSAPSRRCPSSSSRPPPTSTRRRSRRSFGAPAAARRSSTCRRSRSARG